MTKYHLETISDTGILGGAQCVCGHAIRFAHYLTSGAERIIVGACCMKDYLSSDDPEAAKVLRKALLGMYKDAGVAEGADRLACLLRCQSQHPAMNLVWNVKNGKPVPAAVRDLFVELGVLYRAYLLEKKPWESKMALMYEEFQQRPPDDEWVALRDCRNKAGRGYWDRITEVVTALKTAAEKK